ncbi:unnamed protein product [Prorocentrum cordatum]|uniref:Uncharacterized protein n=1 Tax=Prorocentrum cordatum TaxID=2364126 RepID=A0ABN9T972_9DINO|nr:unnamed protein product [Polarella glacialis]
MRHGLQHAQAAGGDAETLRPRLEMPADLPLLYSMPAAKQLGTRDDPESSTFSFPEELGAPPVPVPEADSQHPLLNLFLSPAEGWTASPGAVLDETAQEIQYQIQGLHPSHHRACYFGAPGQVQDKVQTLMFINAEIEQINTEIELIQTEIELSKTESETEIERTKTEAECRGTIQKQPDLRRAWWRFAQLVMNAAWALVTPMRGAMVSSGHQKCIISRMAHARPKRHGVTEMTKAELREEPLTIGDLRTRDDIKHREGPQRSDLASGFSKLRKHEAAALCQAAGIAIEGAFDALKPRIMPLREILAGFGIRFGEAAQRTTAEGRAQRTAHDESSRQSTSSHMSPAGIDDRLDGIREMASRTAATTAEPPSEADWDPDLEKINGDSETETSEASQPTASESDEDRQLMHHLDLGFQRANGLRGALDSRTLPATCLAATIGESAGLNLASGIFRGAESESALKGAHLVVDEDGTAKFHFVEVLGGKAGASWEAARRGVPVGQPWDIEHGDDLTKLATKEELIEFDTEPHAEPRLPEWRAAPAAGAAQGVGDLEARYEGGRMAAPEHPELGRSWDEGPRRRLGQLPGADPGGHEAFERHCGLRCPEDHEHAELQGFGGKETSWSQVYIQAFNGRIVDAFEEVLNQTHQAMAAHADDDSDEAPEEEHMGARAITFGEKARLRRLHRNLGHPSNNDLVGNLSLNGSDDALVRGARHLRCATCNRTKLASTSHRVSRSSLGVGFNGELGADGFYLRNAHGKPYLFPSTVEASTTYRVARYFNCRKPATVAKATDMMGILVKAAARQSQWQNCRTERHRGWLKLMINRAVEHKSVKNRGDLETADWETCQAKNDTRRVCGFSQSQRAHGRSPTTSADLMDRPGLIAEHNMHRASIEFAKRAAIHTAARTAFVELQHSRAPRRALLRKPRVARVNYQSCDPAFYQRLRKKIKLHEWRGPAVAIGPAGASIFCDRHLYREAADLQWQQWESNDAAEPLSIEESQQVRERAHRSRIPTPRFLHRKESAGVKWAPPKPKAPLCCGGHNDPDLTMDLRTNAPTVSRHSALTFPAVAAAHDRDIVVGDVERAFIQGEEHGRAEELYMSQPKEGLPCMDPRCLLNGLVEAELKGESGNPIIMMQSRLDRTVSRGFNEDGRLCNLVCAHADDLLVATRGGGPLLVQSTFIEWRLEPAEIDQAWNRDSSLERNAREIAAGFLVYLCEHAVAEGRPGKATFVDWRSHTLPRVAMSPFAAETQSCTEAFDSAEFVRAVIVEMMYADMDVTSSEMLATIRLLPITSATDCKSLRHPALGPRIPRSVSATDGAESRIPRTRSRYPAADGFGGDSRRYAWGPVPSECGEPLVREEYTLQELVRLGRVEKRTLFMKPMREVFGSDEYLISELLKGARKCRQQSSNCLVMRWVPPDERYHILQACLNAVSSLFGSNYVHQNALGGEQTELFKSTWFCLTVMTPTSSKERPAGQQPTKRGRCSSHFNGGSDTCTFTDMSRILDPEGHAAHRDRE